MPGNRNDKGSTLLTMVITRSRSAGGAAATRSGRTPRKRINIEGAIFSVAHQKKFPPALTVQNTNLLPLFPSNSTGLEGQ